MDDLDLAEYCGSNLAPKLEHYIFPKGLDLVKGRTSLVLRKLRASTSGL